MGVEPRLRKFLVSHEKPFGKSASATAFPRQGMRWRTCRDYSAGSSPPAHNFTVRSHDALASFIPFGDKVTLRTPAVWALSVVKHRLRHIRVDVFFFFGGGGGESAPPHGIIPFERSLFRQVRHVEQLDRLVT